MTRLKLEGLLLLLCYYRRFGELLDLQLFICIMSLFRSDVLSCHSPTLVALALRFIIQRAWAMPFLICCVMIVNDIHRPNYFCWLCSARKSNFVHWVYATPTWPMPHPIDLWFPRSRTSLLSKVCNFVPQMADFLISKEMTSCPTFVVRPVWIFWHFSGFMAAPRVSQSGINQYETEGARVTRFLVCHSGTRTVSGWACFNVQWWTKMCSYERVFCSDEYRVRGEGVEGGKMLKNCRRLI